MLPICQNVNETVDNSAQHKPQGLSLAQVDLVVDGEFEEDEHDAICDAAMREFEEKLIERNFESFESSDPPLPPVEEECLPGFNYANGGSWIYQSNPTIKEYQLKIVETGLFANTLISLTTDLGKSSIVATFVYNFHRWYPDSKIIFMSDSKAELSSQLATCHQYTGIPLSQMAEISEIGFSERHDKLWRERRIFFVTTYALQRDLERNQIDSSEIRCILIDDAHVSYKNSYISTVIQSLAAAGNHWFRILALTSLPIHQILYLEQIVKRLLISKVEARTDKSVDVLPYTHLRGVETKILPLDENTRTLKSCITNELGTWLTELRKIYKFPGLGTTTTPSTSHLTQQLQAAYRERTLAKFAKDVRVNIEKLFVACINISRCSEILETHGLRTLYSHLQEFINKDVGGPATEPFAANLKFTQYIQQLLLRIHPMLKNLPITKKNDYVEAAPITDPPLPESDKDHFLSHPKMQVLRDIVGSEFQSGLEQNRKPIMIFSQHKENVIEIGNMLKYISQQYSTLRPMVFTGRGLMQEEQLGLVREFKEGKYNILVSSCTGEEGIDIGEIDLMIFFDLSTSANRLMKWIMSLKRQERHGNVVFLLAEGFESKTYNEIIHNYIPPDLSGGQFEQHLLKSSPRMVPKGANPVCVFAETLPAVMCNSLDGWDTSITPNTATSNDINPSEILALCRVVNADLV